jgi:hypothetical protein
LSPKPPINLFGGLSIKTGLARDDCGINFPVEYYGNMK